jgi:heterodisulfide reductase subunit B
MSDSGNGGRRPYALYLGCAIPARVQNYEIASRKVAKALGIEFGDISNFACCGYPIASLDAGTARLLAARNLALAEQAGCDICALCTACTGSLTEAAHELSQDPDLLKSINKDLAAVGLRYTGGVKVRHFVRILWEEVGRQKIEAAIVRRLDGVVLAPHYGCHYLKPSEAHGEFEDCEAPHSLDDLIGWMGARPLDYPGKLKCCGGGVLAVDEKLALSISRGKLSAIAERGADAIALICPFCNIMYDTNQKKIETTFGASYQMPVLFFPQALGLAMGFEPRDLGVQMNRVQPRSLLDKIGIK